MTMEQIYHYIRDTLEFGADFSIVGGIDKTHADDLFDENIVGGDNTATNLGGLIIGGEDDRPVKSASTAEDALKKMFITADAPTIKYHRVKTKPKSLRRGGNYEDAPKKFIDTDDNVDYTCATGSSELTDPTDLNDYMVAKEINDGPELGEGDELGDDALSLKNLVLDQQ